ncbi:2,3-bisphosphoglycerate-independent phosphoglycerate mutase [Thalassospira tepidiphila]|uniref:2,3-bisphosphoglycerate-independent phosphoglycerate mutase n=1 Tax=Thalassospira tepidiphila TaxID=393657 RepID=UPI001BCC73F9|nr:2,3-bisphosphoglycerate-independent phosphoglycerate mutase [Thalassospira tepidiphila]MBS8274123.1 2,3-bisphosphoglycerate-independent phosphoglycerate mutase [Thalassospira tepidiphila]
MNVTVSNSVKRPRPVVLCILDGWGYREESKNNAVALANTPVWDDLYANNPTGFLKACGLDVGLPEGQMGNSEVGHMNLGAGRVVMQELPKIDEAVKTGTIAETATVKKIIAKLSDSKGVCHIAGLLSEGGVHSHQAHMAALAKIIAAAGVPVKIHAYLDGRDTAPKSAAKFLEKFRALIGDANVEIATVTGRYYAMDRDNRWERVSQAYFTMVQGKNYADGRTAESAEAAIAKAYEADTTDEFVLPTVIGDYAGMKDGDGLLMTNFRADRAREILAALCAPDFDGFDRGTPVKFAVQAGMVEYSSEHAKYMDAIYPPQTLPNIFGEVVSKAGMKQLRIAETEKYPHVSFFFNGGEEQVFDGEERILVASPKVATYDLQPEMSAPEVTDKLVAAIKSEKYDTIILNFANPDMVGHSGILEAAMKAAEAVDTCLGKVIDAIKSVGGVAFVTADHGNCEVMVDPETGEPHTAHTLNLVPTILVNGPEGVTLEDGRLADVAPTLLQLLGVPQPAEMTGKPLLKGMKENDALLAS